MSRAMLALVARECGDLETARSFAPGGQRVLSHRHALENRVRAQRLRDAGVRFRPVRDRRATIRRRRRAGRFDSISPAAVGELPARAARRTIAPMRQQMGEEALDQARVKGASLD